MKNEVSVDYGNEDENVEHEIPQVCDSFMSLMTKKDLLLKQICFFLLL